MAGVSSEPTRSVNAGESGSVAGAAGAVEAPVAPALCGPFGRPCFFCNGPTPMKDRWVLLPAPVSSDMPDVFMVVTAAEGLHPCYLNQNGARSVLVDHKYLGIKPSECEDVCGSCGERESADEKIEPTEDPAFTPAQKHAVETAQRMAATPSPVVSDPKKKPRARTGPVNSLGEPWAGDEEWVCSKCQKRGPDRDDVQLPDCLTQREPHDLTYGPLEHHEAVMKRRAWAKALTHAGAVRAHEAGYLPEGVPEATPPHGNPKARVPFTREIALESLGPKCAQDILDELVKCPEDDYVSLGSRIVTQAKRVHEPELVERRWEEAGGKWSAPSTKGAAKRLGMKAGQWRRFVMSLPALKPPSPDAAEAVAEIASSHGTERAL